MNFLFTAMVAAATLAYQPSATYTYAERDGEPLLMDVYNPAAGSDTLAAGKPKPTILYIHGGSFMFGDRNPEHANKWFGMMTEAGYRVVSIDYRLGLKNAKKLKLVPKSYFLLLDALNEAVEDTFSAVNYLSDNSEKLGVDPDNIVIVGSSAGALTALQAEMYICSGNEIASALPEGFNFAGVVSMAGCTLGPVKYNIEPCPTLMIYGNDDQIVPFRKIAIFNIRAEGSRALSSRYAKAGYNFATYEFEGHSHEMAGAMQYTQDKILSFIENNVCAGQRTATRELVYAPEIPSNGWSGKKLSDLVEEDDPESAGKETNNP